MSNKVEKPTDTQGSVRRKELLFDVETLSTEQLETGVQVAEEFTDHHLASQARQNQAKEGSTLSQAKQWLIWSACFMSIGLFGVAAITLTSLVVIYVRFLSDKPEQVGTLLWAIFTYSLVAAASLYFQKILRRNLD